MLRNGNKTAENWVLPSHAHRAAPHSQTSSHKTEDPVIPTMDSSDEDSFIEYVDSEEWSRRCPKGLPTELAFDCTAIEKLILDISDKFDFRVVMGEETSTAMLITAGLSLAGGLIGRKYGKVGMAIGGAAGGVCALGIVAISMRQLWKEVQGKLCELHELVHDYLSGLSVEDYATAARLLATHPHHSNQLAKLLLTAASDLLGKRILSTLND